MYTTPRCWVEKKIHLLACACGTFTPFFTTKGFPGSLSHLFNFPMHVPSIHSGVRVAAAIYEKGVKKKARNSKLKSE